MYSLRIKHQLVYIGNIFKILNENLKGYGGCGGGGGGGCHHGHHGGHHHGGHGGGCGGGGGGYVIGGRC